MLVKLLKKVNSAMNKVLNIDDIIKYNILERDLHNKSYDLSNNIIDDSGDIIVSLTTYNKRVHEVYLVIESIAQQTVKPKNIILWLSESEFNQKKIPLTLVRQQIRGLDIRYCKDIRSYKKLIPTLIEYPNDTILTIDDDIIYPHDMIECMLKESKRYPGCIIANIAHTMNVKNEKILPYKTWKHNSDFFEPSKVTFPIGAGGILYPPKSFHSDVINEDKFLNLSPSGDDIWFKAMTLLNGTMCKIVNDSRKFNDRISIIKNTQDIGLSHTNVNGLENDNQIYDVFKDYDILNKVFK